MVRGGRPISLEFLPAFKQMENSRYLEIYDDAKKRFKEFEGIEGADYVFNYPLLQTAQMVDLIENYGVVGQVGWDSAKKLLPDMNFEQLISVLRGKRLSEKFFIDLLKNRYPEIEFATDYVPTAIDFGNGNQQSPYTIMEGAIRPRIDKRFSKFCAETKGLKGYDKALARIEANVVGRFENLYGEMSGSTIQKVDEIQNLMGVLK